MSLSVFTRTFIAVLLMIIIGCYGGIGLFTSTWPVYGLPKSIDGLRQLERRLQDFAEENYLGKHRAWGTYATVHACIDRRAMNNFSVMKSPNDRLYRGGIYPLNLGAARMLGQDLAELGDIALESGVEIFYLGLPDSRMTEVETLPTDLPYLDFNAAVDTLLFRLREGGVAQLDTRHELIKQGLDPEQIVRKTAFQLTGEASFAAFSYLVQALDTNFSIHLDPDGYYRDTENYSFGNLPQFFLGDLGKETGAAFSGLEDFTVIAPKFATEFVMDAVDRNGVAISAEGTAEETIYNPEALEYRGDYYTFYPQTYYVHNNMAWSRITNTLLPDGPKILFIHDFYSAEIIELLAPLCGELHTLAYPQNYQADPLTAERYLAENNVDVVITSFFPQNILNSEVRDIILEEREDEALLK